MCYDISITTDLRVLSDYFPDLKFDAQVNIDFTSDHVQAQAYQPYPVIVNEGNGPVVKSFEWGVIADYMKTPEEIKKMRSSMCNSRSEKVVADRRSFWWRIMSQRCLIPVSGIYEHRYVNGFKNKIPYYIQLKNRSVFMLPGLFHYSRIPDKETGELPGTFTIITRAANAVMRAIHNNGDNAGRMPLFLKPDLELQWIKPGLSDVQIQSIFDFEMPDAELNYHAVYSIRGRKPRPDEKAKTEPYEWLNLEEIVV